MEQLSYSPRARFCGNAEWLCPLCGTLNKSRLDYTSRQFECKGRNCSKRFHVGLKLWLHTRKGSGGRPIPPEAFPMVEVTEWRRRSARAQNHSSF
jgi:hypothetical protein